MFSADRMGLSPHTIHQYVKAIYQRMAVTSRAGLLAAVLQKRGRSM